MCGEEGEEVCLPAISTVWECVYINYKDVNGKEGWECQRCGLSFKPRHATRAMRHVLKLKGGDIANCKAVISAKYRDVAMSGTTSPVTVGIIDCTTHMAEGGKKDAAYISGIFDEKVMEYDPKMSLTDLFFFDGSAVSVNNASVGHSEEQRCHMPWWKWQWRISFIARISPMQWWNHLDSSD